MYVTDKLKKNQTNLSFEFFPPKSEKAKESLLHTLGKLTPIRPGYISVTYGAGGGESRELTHQLVKKLHTEGQFTVVPHLTCVGTTKALIHDILSEYDELGIKNILALRGDLPEERRQRKPDFYYAADLVAYIKEHFPQMEVGVAGFPEGHPETPNRLKDMEHLKAKVDAGASYICTQLFFDNNVYYDFVERCLLYNIEVPVVAGIMPITSKSNLMRMAELALSTNIPARLLKNVMRAKNDEYVEEVGVHWALEQVRDLIDRGVRGIHLYTLNKSKASLKICRGLGIQNLEDLNKPITL